MPKLFKTYKNFNKGLNDSIAQDILEESELVKAQNITLTTKGGYYKREGCNTLYEIGSNSTSEPVTAIVRYVTESVDEILAVRNKTLYKYIEDNNPEVLKADLNVFHPSFQFFTNGSLYFVDGDDYYVYNGTSVTSVVAADGTDLTHIKRCTVIKQRGQRMFATGDSENPNSLYFSEIGEPNNFPASNVINAISDDGDSLTTIEELGNYLIAFKDENVYAWSGWNPTSDVSFDKLPVSTGTKYPRSVVKADNMLIFLSQDNSIVGLSINDSGGITVSNLSVSIENTLKSLVNKDKIQATYYNGEYLLACCDDLTLMNNLVLRGYVKFSYSTYSDKSGETKTIPWTTIRGWQADCWYKDDIDNKLYFGSKNGYIEETFVGKSDYGNTPIVLDVIHRFNLTDSFRVKKIKSLFLLVSQAGNRLFNARLKLKYMMYEADIEIYDLDLNETMIWGVSNWGAQWGTYVDILKKEIRLNKTCDRLQVEITQNEVNASNENDLILYGFGVTFRIKKPKGEKEGITIGTVD